MSTLVYEKLMNTIVYENLVQGSPEWHKARCGIITASQIGKFVKKNGDLADNETVRCLINEIACQRITGFTDHIPTTFAMERGHDDEDEARDIYSEKIEPVSQIGFMTRNFDGMKLGYSPDGLVANNGLIEVKSRMQKYQLNTIINLTIPDEYKAQVQLGMLISSRKWCDFISYPACGGGKMFVVRVEADTSYQAKLLEAAFNAEAKIQEKISLYNAALKDESVRFFDTERRDYNNPAEVEFSE